MIDELIAAPIQCRAQLRELSRVERENTDDDVAVMIAEHRKNVMAQLDAIWGHVSMIDMVMPGFARYYRAAMIYVMGNNDEERKAD